MKKLLALAIALMLLLTAAVVVAEEDRDTTRAVIEEVSPSNGGTVTREGQIVTVIAHDPESGIDRVKYQHGSCNTNLRYHAERTVFLERDGEDRFASEVDFSMYEHGVERCFRIAVFNGDQLKTVREGWFNVEERDTSRPRIVRMDPWNGDFVKSENHQVKAKVLDEESGVERVTFQHNLCDEPRGERQNLFRRGGNWWEERMDFSEYENGQEVCFRYKATNGVGLHKVFEGSFTVDDRKPRLEITHYERVVDGQPNIFLRARDNFDENLRCRMKVDGRTVKRFNHESGRVHDYRTGPISDGWHRIKFVCNDNAGNKGWSQQVHVKVE